MTKRRAKDLRIGLLFISPWLIGLFLFHVLPLSSSLYYSFTNYSVIRSPKWIGLENYKLLLNDRSFRISVKNSFYFTCIGVPLMQIAALILASMLHSVKGSKIMRWARVIYLFPILIPGVVMAIIWSLLLNGQYGVFNFLIRSLGLNPPNWLQDPTWAKPAIILVGFWFIGNSMLIYLTALNDVPKELYESAKIDGANWWTKLRKITVPMISPAILFNLITGMITILQLFDLPYVMTKGGPVKSTYTWTMHIYDNAFRFLSMGYACASAWILFGVTLLLTILIFVMSRKSIYYGGE
ncbi:MAG: sugar ABC transporter permease [Thermotoga sp.]|nr:MAG: sugar ABC transporter permease [Thermotoga sp.]